jgi:hypothetical protein
MINQEQVIFDIAANFFRGIEAVGGRLKITGEKLKFEPHKLNIQTAILEIQLNEILIAEKRNTLFLVPNGMKVKLKSGKEYKFVLWNRGKVIDYINKKTGNQ